MIGVRPGTYSVRVSLIGYGTTVVENVRVQIDQTTDLDFDTRRGGLRRRGDRRRGRAAARPTRPHLVVRRRSRQSSWRRCRSSRFRTSSTFRPASSTATFAAAAPARSPTSWTASPSTTCTTSRSRSRSRTTPSRKSRSSPGPSTPSTGRRSPASSTSSRRTAGDATRLALSGYGGDYAHARDTDLFQRRSSALSPTGERYEVQGSAQRPRPGLGDRLTFFASGRFVRNGGYLYGRRVVQPITRRPDEGQHGRGRRARRSSSPPSETARYASMNWSQQTTGQLKLTARVSSADGSRSTASSSATRARTTTTSSATTPTADRRSTATRGRFTATYTARPLEHDASSKSREPSSTTASMRPSTTTRSTRAIRPMTPCAQLGGNFSLLPRRRQA